MPYKTICTRAWKAWATLMIYSMCGQSQELEVAQVQVAVLADLKILLLEVMASGLVSETTMDLAVPSRVATLRG